MLLAGQLHDWLFLKASLNSVDWTVLCGVINTYRVVDFLDPQALANSTGYTVPRGLDRRGRKPSLWKGTDLKTENLLAMRVSETEVSQPEKPN